MIINAKVAKLNQYSGDPAFDRVMSEIESATEEGLQNFEVSVIRLELEMISDIRNALEAMDYVVDYVEDLAILEIGLD